MNVLVAAKTSTTSWSQTLTPGVYYYEIAAFNGYFRTFSPEWQFEICAPGHLAPPVLSPAPSTLQIGNISLSWAINWNDTCEEDHQEYVTIWTNSSVIFTSDLLNETQTSLFFTEDEVTSLGIYNGVTYSWSVQAFKGSQKPRSNSSFVYCKPAPELVELGTPSTCFIGFILMLQSFPICKWHCSSVVEHIVG